MGFRFRVSQIQACLFGGSPFQGCSLLGSILGSPYVGKLPYTLGLSLELLGGLGLCHGNVEVPVCWT